VTCKTGGGGGGEMYLKVLGRHVAQIDLFFAVGFLLDRHVLGPERRRILRRLTHLN
jgi:hypothetical protein